MSTSPESHNRPKAASEAASSNMPELRTDAAAYISTDAPQTEKLQKVLARTGVASRRASERMIESGRVQVNGEVAYLGQRVRATDEILVDGASLLGAREQVTIILNKPKGYLTSMSDPFGRPCISELLPLDVHPSMFPIGRLDKDTTGLLLCSTDGELALSLIHPRYHVEKIYRAQVAGVVKPEELLVFEMGITLDDGKTKPAHARLISSGDEISEVEIILTEGKKRQVKRMMEAIGHPVVELARIQFDHLTLDGVSEGTWRYLTAEEEQRLYEIHAKIRDFTTTDDQVG